VHRGIGCLRGDGRMKRLRQVRRRPPGRAEYVQQRRCHRNCSAFTGGCPAIEDEGPSRRFTSTSSRMVEAADIKLIPGKHPPSRGEKQKSGAVEHHGMLRARVSQAIWAKRTHRYQEGVRRQPRPDG